MNMSCSTVIVGIGSPHGDDQFGWAVLDRLAEMELGGVKLRKISNPIDLIAELETHDDVMLVDASVGLPRDVPFLKLAYHNAVDRKLIENLQTYSTHDLGLASTLQLAASLGNRTHHVKLWIGRGTSFEPLSEMNFSTMTAASDCAIAIGGSCAMHEMSLVKSLLAQVQSIVDENEAESAAEVCVEIGPLSGVESELVKSAFGQLVRERGSRIGQLTIHQVPLVVRCRDCERESELNDFVFRCHECGSGRVQVIGGDEFRLVSITLNEGHAHA